MMEPRTKTAVDWLLESAEPAIRCMARRDLLGGKPSGESVLDGPKVQALPPPQECWASAGGAHCLPVD